MISRHALAAGVLVIVLVLASCTLGPPPAAPLQATRGSGAITASLTVVPAPPAPMQDALLELRLFDSQEQPLSGANVSLDLTMPGMQMPVNRPQVVESSRGVYQAKTLFTMAGKWQIRVDVRYAGQNETLNFDLHTRE